MIFSNYHQTKFASATINFGTKQNSFTNEEKAMSKLSLVFLFFQLNKTTQQSRYKLFKREREMQL